MPTDRFRFCRNAPDDLRHFSAGGRICCGDSTGWTAASCFARARLATCAIFQQADERILLRRFNGVDSRVWFCRNATFDLRHLSADGQDAFVAEIQRRGQPHPVLQERDRRLAAFFSGREG